MTKTFLIAAAILSSVTAYAQKKPVTPKKKTAPKNTVAVQKVNPGFVIEGNIQGADKAKAYLLRRVGGEQHIDSTEVLNGSFSFKDTISAPSTATLVVRNGEDQARTILVLERGTIKVAGKASAPGLIVSGTQENDVYSQYNSKLYAGNPGWETEFEKKYVAAHNAKDTVALKKYEEEYRKMDKDNAKVAADVIRANRSSYVAPVLLSMKMSSIDIDTANALLKLIEAAPVQYELTARLRDAVDKKLATAPGKMAPEISEKDTAGVNEISLSSLKGKYVLIDFWASWCGPCRAENPNVVAAYHKFKDKNFTIYSVSLDRNKTSWIKAIKDDKLDWPYHVSDLQYWNSASAKKYGVNGIPANFLLDPSGKIIATDLRGEELHEKLAEVIK